MADADNKITYVEYLDNINTDPNYEAAVVKVYKMRLRSLFYFAFLTSHLQSIASCYYCIAISIWIVEYKKGDSMSEKERPQPIIDYEANTDKLVA